MFGGEDLPMERKRLYLRAGLWFYSGVAVLKKTSFSLADWFGDQIYLKLAATFPPSTVII